MTLRVSLESLTGLDKKWPAVNVNFEKKQPFHISPTRPEIIGEKFTDEPGECTIKFIITFVLSVGLQRVGGREEGNGQRYQMDVKFIH